MSEKVDLSKVKIGDTVLIKGEVIQIIENTVRVKSPFYMDKPVWLTADDIGEHIPQPVVWEVGDNFTRHGRGPWEILFIDDSSVLLEDCGKDGYRYLHARHHFDNWTDKERVE